MFHLILLSCLFLGWDTVYGIQSVAICEVPLSECYLQGDVSCALPSSAVGCKKACGCRSFDSPTKVYCYDPKPDTNECVSWTNDCRNLKAISSTSKPSTSTASELGGLKPTESPLTLAPSSSSPSSSSSPKPGEKDKEENLDKKGNAEEENSETQSSGFPSYGYALIIGGVIAIVLVYLAYKFCCNFCADNSSSDHVYHESHYFRMDPNSVPMSRTLGQGYEEEANPRCVVYPVFHEQEQFQDNSITSPTSSCKSVVL